MGIETRKFHVTSDGKPFENPLEAGAHEYDLKKAEVIEEFLDDDTACDYSPRGRASARRIVGDFLDMVSDNDLTLPWVDVQNTRAAVKAVAEELGPEDAQFIETRKLQVEDVARAFRREGAQ